MQVGMVECHQHVADRQHRLFMLGRSVAVAQHHLHDVVRGIAGQEFIHHCRQFAFAAMLCQQGIGGTAGMLQAFAPALGFRGPLFRELEALAMLRHVRAQFLLQRLEDRDVFVELRDQAVDRLVHAPQQLAFLRRFAMVAFAGLGDGVEQPARGMLLEQEHAAILHRHLHVWHQHATDLAADVGVVLGTVEQHVEQQRDQVDGILVQAVQVQVVPGHAKLLGTGDHLLAQLFGKRLLRIPLVLFELFGHVPLQQATAPTSGPASRASAKGQPPFGLRDPRPPNCANPATG